MKTKYVKPMMMGVFEAVAQGDACNPGSTPDAANCYTGGLVNNPIPATACESGGMPATADCSTGNIVRGCATGGTPSSSCVSGTGVGG